MKNCDFVRKSSENQDYYGRSHFWSIPWGRFVWCWLLRHPPIPGGTTASYKILFVQLVLSMESLAIVLTLNVLLDFLRTAVNLFAGQCVLIIVSRKPGLVSSQNE